KSLRFIEYSDLIVRRNTHESTMLDLRLQKLKRQKTMFIHHYNQDIQQKRLELEQFLKSLEPLDQHDDSGDDEIVDMVPQSRLSRLSRQSTTTFKDNPMSFYSIKLRNASAPVRSYRTSSMPKVSLDIRPNTTVENRRLASAHFLRNKSALSVFKDITLRPPCKNILDMLVLVKNNDMNEKPIYSNNYLRKWSRQNIRRFVS
ncbi:unnamed protein product, partial [Didymodactylos carnosus]